MKKIGIAALATSLVLAGCYQSKTLLLDVSQAVHPFADGTWIGDDEDKTEISLVSRGNYYLMSEGESKNDVVLTPLAGHANTWAAAEAEPGCGEHPAECEWEYAVVVGQGNAFREIGPDCEKDWPAISKHVASRSKDGDTCWFDDAGKLQQALAWVADNGKNAISYAKK